MRVLRTTIQAIPSSIKFCRVTRMGLLVLTGLFLAACAGGSSDRSSAMKMADVLKGKTKQEGLIAMVYQHDAELVERSAPGAKSSGTRDVPHSCRATVILKDGRVTDVRYESVPEWLGAENHCDEIFARCSQ